jgi:hypothetical protein
MMKKLFMFAVLAVVILTVSGISFGAVKTEKFVGYLADVACATAVTSADGFNLNTEPEKHTVACMMASGCAASGYGIEINEGTSEAKNYVFTKFDKKGNELAVKLLKKTKKKDNVSIEVRGVKDGDIIKVSSLKETKMKK